MITIKDFKKNGYLGEEIKTFIADNTKYYEEIFLFCEELNTYSYDIIEKSNHKKGDIRGTVVMSLFVKILNAFQGAIILYKYGLEAEAQTVARPALESLFILAAIDNEEGFYDNFIKLADLEREKILTKIEKYPESYPDYQSIPELQQLDELRDNNKREGITDYKKWKIAKFANMEIQYNNAYDFLSNAIHPNIGNLCGRYWNHDGEIVNEIRCAPYLIDIYYTLKILCVILVEAIACLDDYFHINLTDELKPKAERIKVLFAEK